MKEPKPFLEFEAVVLAELLSEPAVRARAAERSALGMLYRLEAALRTAGRIEIHRWISKEEGS